MRKICCLNQISHYGTDRLTGDYTFVDDIKDAEGVMVRSASLHETEFPERLRRSREPEPESTTSRSMSARKRESSYSTHRVQIRTV